MVPFTTCDHIVVRFGQSTDGAGPGALSRAHRDTRFTSGCPWLTRTPVHGTIRAIVGMDSTSIAA